MSNSANEFKKFDRIRALHECTQEIIQAYRAVEQSTFIRSKNTELPDFKELIDNVKDLRDLETYNTFYLAFGPGTQMYKKLKSDSRFQATNSTGLIDESYSAFMGDEGKSGIKQELEEARKQLIEEGREKAQQVQQAVNVWRGNSNTFEKAAGRLLGKVSKTLKHQNISDETAIDLIDQDSEIQKYTVHVYNSIQHLVQLDVMMTRVIDAFILPGFNIETFKDFRDDVRQTHELMSERVMSENSFLFLEEGTLLARFQKFLTSPEFHSIQYALADLKFKFTNEVETAIDSLQNQIEKKVLKDDSFVKSFRDAFEKSDRNERLSVYKLIRAITGFSSLESDKKYLGILANADINKDVITRVKDILCYMDGMISVRAVIEAQKPKRKMLGEFEKDSQKIAHAIMMGLDKDMGFTRVIEQDYGENANAYISGCIEECMINSRRDLFTRFTFKDYEDIDNDRGLSSGQKEIVKAQANIGQLEILKTKLKQDTIRLALGVENVRKDDEIYTGDKKIYMPEQTFVDPSRVNIDSLNQLYDASTKLFKQGVTVSAIVPVYLVLSAIKPLELESPDNLTSKDVDNLKNKIKSYQDVLETMKIGFGTPSRGRARMALDFTYEENLKEQARHMFDRLLHFYMTHQREISQLPKDVLVDLQKKNEEIFADLGTFFVSKMTKKMAKALAEQIWTTMVGRLPIDEFTSEHKRRQVKFEHVKAKTLAQLDQNEITELYGMSLVERIGKGLFSIFSADPKNKISDLSIELKGVPLAEKEGNVQGAPSNPEIKYMEVAISKKSKGSLKREKKLQSIDYELRIQDLVEIIRKTEDYLKSRGGENNQELVLNQIKTEVLPKLFNINAENFPSVLEQDLDKAYKQFSESKGKYDKFIEQYNSPEILLRYLHQQILKQDKIKDPLLENIEAYEGLSVRKPDRASSDSIKKLRTRQLQAKNKPFDEESKEGALDDEFNLVMPKPSKGDSQNVGGVGASNPPPPVSSNNQVQNTGGVPVSSPPTGARPAPPTGARPAPPTGARPAPPPAPPTGAPPAPPTGAPPAPPPARNTNQVSELSFWQSNLVTVPSARKNDDDEVSLVSSDTRVTRTSLNPQNLKEEIESGLRELFDKLNQAKGDDFSDKYWNLFGEQGAIKSTEQKENTKLNAKLRKCIESYNALVGSNEQLPGVSKSLEKAFKEQNNFTPISRR